jgi:hypothetical protein
VCHTAQLVEVVYLLHLSAPSYFSKKEFDQKVIDAWRARIQAREKDSGSVAGEGEEDEEELRERSAISDGKLESRRRNGE